MHYRVQRPDGRLTYNTTLMRNMQRTMGWELAHTAWLLNITSREGQGGEQFKVLTVLFWTRDGQTGFLL